MELSTRVSAEENMQANSLPELCEAAGNKFKVNYYSLGELDLVSVKQDAHKCFENYPHIDTVLVTENIGNNKFNYLVIERDGSLSEMCGNGARAVAKYLYDQKLADESDKINLVTLSGKNVSVEKLFTEDGEKYKVNMGKVTSVSDDPESFDQYLTKESEPQIGYEDTIREAKKYLENSSLLNDIFPDSSDLSNYDSYFLNRLELIFKNPKEVTLFSDFLKSLDYKGLYQAGGEPQMIVELTDITLNTELNETKFNVFLKMVSFLNRFKRDEKGQKVYPSGLNFMFYEVSSHSGDNLVKMYPSERGVYNGVDFDHTGACGTGSVCLANYLLKNDDRFSYTNNIPVINRSNDVLRVEIDESGDSYLLGDAEYSDTETAQEKTTFTTQSMLEKRNYFNPKGEESIFNFFRSLAGTQLDAFSKIHDELGNNIYTTANHPNFATDMYTALSIYRQSELAGKLGMTTVNQSLDTTGHEPIGKIYPNIVLGKGSHPFLSLIQNVVKNSSNPVKSELLSAVQEEIAGKVENTFFDPLVLTRDNSKFSKEKDLVVEAYLSKDINLKQFFTENEVQNVRQVIESYRENIKAVRETFTHQRQSVRSIVDDLVSGNLDLESAQKQLVEFLVESGVEIQNQKIEDVKKLLEDACGDPEKSDTNFNRLIGSVLKPTMDKIAANSLPKNIEKLNVEDATSKMLYFLMTSNPDLSESSLVSPNPNSTSTEKESVKLNQYSRRDVWRHAIIATAISTAIEDYYSNPIIKYNQITNENKKLNILQNNIKNRLLELFLRQSTTIEQKEIMQKAGLMNHKYELDIPLVSGVENEVHNNLVSAIQTIINQYGVDFILGYFKYILSDSSGENGKSKKIVEILNAETNSYMTILCGLDGDDLKFATASKVKIDSDTLKAMLINNLESGSGIGAIFGDLEIMVYALGGITQLGSERGVRFKALNYIKQLPEFANDQAKINELYERSKGLECDSYNPKMYHPDLGLVDPNFPAGTDYSSPSEYLPLLSMLGSEMSQIQFQQLLEDDHKIATIKDLPFAQKCGILFKKSYKTAEELVDDFKSKIRN